MSRPRAELRSQLVFLESGEILTGQPDGRSGPEWVIQTGGRANLNDRSAMVWARSGDQEIVARGRARVSRGTVYFLPARTVELCRASRPERIPVGDLRATVKGGGRSATLYLTDVGSNGFGFVCGDKPLGGPVLTFEFKVGERAVRLRGMASHHHELCPGFYRGGAALAIRTAREQADWLLVLDAALGEAA